MNKLQYDSFYKFIVSVGIILITAPILGIYYYFTGSNDILITRQEFSELSDFSLQALNNRMTISRIISIIFPCICFILIALGLVCIIYGCIKWHKIQADLDEQTHLDTFMKRINAQQLTPTEIAERTINEVIEDNNDSSSSTSVISHQQQEAIMRGFRMEKLYYDYLYRHQRKFYDIKQNIRVGSKEYDIVAVSKLTNTDYLYEIKAWNSLNPQAIHHQITSQKIISKMEEDSLNYIKVTKRNCIYKLVIITSKKYVNETNMLVSKILNNSYEFEIECYSEDQLSD